jgi:hypothetical protein
VAHAVSCRPVTRSHGFASGSNHVGFVVGKVELGQVFLQVLRCSPVNIIPPSYSILIYHLGDEQYICSELSSGLYCRVK